jgi:hypothetical protein
MKAPSLGMMVRLLYVSRSAGPQTTTVTRSILEKAQGHNSAQGITGVLCQGQGFFIQVLEGERSRVNALFRRIAADPRHKDVELLQYEEIQQRQFSKWSMALVNLSVDDPMIRLQHPEYDPYSASGTQVMQLLMDLLASGQPINLTDA